MRSELTKLLRAQPFVRFSVHANDGRVFNIDHVDFCLVTPNAAYIYVELEGDYEVVRLAFSAITSLDSKEQAA